jgi:hypothetical protein
LDGWRRSDGTVKGRAEGRRHVPPGARHIKVSDIDFRIIRARGPCARTTVSRHPCVFSFSSRGPPPSFSPCRTGDFGGFWFSGDPRGGIGATKPLVAAIHGPMDGAGQQSSLGGSGGVDKTVGVRHRRRAGRGLDQHASDEPPPAATIETLRRDGGRG